MRKVAQSPMRTLLRSLRLGARGQPTAERLADLKPELLREVDILRDLSQEDTDWLKHTTTMVVYQPGQVIYSPDRARETLYLLKHGRVQIYRLSADGRKLEVLMLDGGTFFGDLPLLHLSMSGTFAEATEESLLCLMGRSDVERLILRRPEVALRMLGVLSARLAASESRQAALAFQPVRTRLAAALIRLARDGEVRATHQELADMVGAYRETVTKTLDELRRAGMVELGRMRIVVCDRVALEQVARTTAAASD